MRNRFIAKISFFGILLIILNYSATAQSNSNIYVGLEVLPGDDTVSQRLKVIGRYQIGPQLSAGLGTGFTYYNDPLSLLPVFVDLQYKLFRTKLSPFVFLNTGYNISILTDTQTRIDNHRGGWMLNPGIGLQFTSDNGPGWHLSVGYNIDHSQFNTQEGTSRIIETDISYKRLMAGFGLSFSL